MLVSGIPSFRGGGGTEEERVCGRAVSVISGRLEDCWAGRKEEKEHLCARKQRVHLLVAAGWEAKRNIVAIEGPLVRRVAMMRRRRWQRDDAAGIGDEVVESGGMVVEKVR